MSIWEWLLNPAGLTAHGFCLSWAPGLVALHAVSDALIGLAYFSIPLALAWFVWQRHDFQHWRIAYLFVAFILACGATHLFSILTLWVPAYGVEGLVKALTAALSITTAIVLWPLVPRLLTLPSPELLVALNAELSRRIATEEEATARLRDSEAGIRALNANLERRVAERTSALEAEIAARRDAEEKFRQVIEAAPTAIIMIDGEGTIELVNSQTERTFGYSRGELLGRSVDILLPDRLRANHGHHRATFFAAPTSRAMGIGRDLFGRRKDGSEFSVEIGLNPLLTPEGQKVISSIADITKRKEMEKALRDMMEKQTASIRELERSNQELDDFAYIASHDLKEPLRGLFNHAAFLREDYSDKIDEDGVRRLTRLGQLCQRMERLINDLLYFSRLGRAELAVRQTDPNAIIVEIQQMMETLLSERHARIVVPRALPQIVCDAARVTEVFRNLVTNAIKYNDKSERLVEIGFLESVDAGGRSERNVFYVRDNGVGIDPTFHQEIFRIFKRLQNSSDGTDNGAGVGLTFVKKIVERHGGRIWLESEPGKGTVFYFNLNCGRSESARNPHEARNDRIPVHSAG